MRRTSIWRAGLLTAAALLTPRLASAQGFDYAPADPVLPLPLYSTQPGLGGLYLYGDFVFFHQTNPLRQQEIGMRGFVDSDGSVTARPPGTFIGSAQNVLDVNQVRGPSTYEPGFRVGGGWKFEDGSAFSVDFIYIALARYSAAATSAPQNFQTGANGENTFLTAFVFNFPNQYSGPANKTGFNPPNSTTQIGNNFALYGIWNGASIMTLEFVQRAEGIDATYRVPVYETESYRLSGIVGPRYFWIWERFRWRTTSLSFDGTSVPSDVALFSNITSNEMYGAFIGCENEWYIGHGFATYVNFDAAVLLDHVKEQDSYELGSKDAGPKNKRAILDYTVAPEIEAKAGIAWYLAEGIQFRLDYNAMVFFNTIASPRPVSFNYGGLDPGWEHVTRLLDGITAGLALTF
jgi:major outer membrane protein